VIILDGGLSNALEDRGHDVSGALWTARLLLDAPDEIAAVHRTYFQAGADVVTTASYQASVAGFGRLGLDEDQARELIRRSVAIARQVRDELASDGRSRFVAASVGPYGAVLADGSEYRGRYGLTKAQLREFHAPRLELLAEAGPDLLAVETIPDVEEAEVLVDLLDEAGLPAWVSFSARDQQTRAGQPLAEAYSVAASSSSTIAVGVNCITPEDVLDAVRLAVEVTGLPAVAYPNSGETWDAGARRWVGPPAHARQTASWVGTGLATGWVGAGAAYVGGCCRVGPAEIAALVDELGRA
jgi:homocysteine S-methyltransferase